MSLEEKVRRYFSKQLRRLFQRSPIRSAVYEEYAKGGKWSCYICQGVSPYKQDFQVEHVEPVVPPERPVASFEYFTRMFGYGADGGLTIDNLRLVCKGCHHTKTAEEDERRRAHGTGRFSQAAKMKAAETKARRRAARARKARKPRRKTRKAR